MTELGSNILGAKVIHSGQFWNFAYRQLTNHEKERYATLKNIWTERGKTKALIRSNLNERSLERSILIWLGCNLSEFYESWALIREEKCKDLLPKLASDLNKVLFAISIDQADFNVAGGVAIKTPNKTEPIVSPPPASRIKIRENHREIKNFDETSNNKSPSTYQLTKPPFPVHGPIESAPSKNLSSNSSLSSSVSSASEVNQMAVEISPTKSTPGNPFEDPEPELIDIMERTSIRRSISSITSSSVSTVSSKPSEPGGEKESRGGEVNHIPISNFAVEEKLKDRIRELEAQVGELLLENTRLKNLAGSPKMVTLSPFTVAIPRAVLKKSPAKNHYTYEIHVKSKIDLDEWTIFKRYRDFYNLHKKLKKEHLTVKALDFPPKKKIGNMDAEFVEHRRQRLQVYLRHLISLLPEIANCDSRQSLEEKFPFLK